MRGGIVFRGNVASRRMLRRLLGVRLLGNPDKYLGLPLFLGKSKQAAFSCLLDRLDNRTQGWKSKLLSQAGRTTLIKVVTNSLPLYSMSCFSIPKTI